MKPPASSASVSLKIVSSAAMDTAKRDAKSRLFPGPGQCETWERLHESFKLGFVQHGKRSWDPDPLADFYFTGDWFHENSGGFGICAVDPISKELLLKLPRVLSAHHRDAVLEMNGIDDPIQGLVIFVTSTGVLVGWQDLCREASEERLRNLGVTLD